MEPKSEPKSEEERASEELIRAFIQFGRLRLEEKNHRPGGPMHHGLKHSEIMILLGLKEKEARYPDGVSVSEISRTLCVKPPTVTLVIAGLEQRGLIERTMDLSDRRVVRIKMTEKGGQFLENHRRHVIKEAGGLVRALGTEKSLLLASLIDDVFDYYKEQGLRGKQS